VRVELEAGVGGPSGEGVVKSVRVG